jgi:3D (Asp-Asp-Asp) domain-containing protein
MYYDIAIEGMPPGIIMNSCAGMTENALDPKKQSIKRQSPEAEAESVAYRLPPAKGFKRGELYIPSRCIMAAILNVSAQYKIKVGGNKKPSKKFIAGCSNIVPENIGLGVESYEVHRSPCVIGSARVVKAHPRILPWQARFQLHFYDNDPVASDVGQAIEVFVEEMLGMAGSIAGLLDNRPSSPKKPGNHGRFRVLSCKRVA